MKNATKLGCALALFVLFGAMPTQAQTAQDVTFKVDMTEAMRACQHVPDDGDIVSVNGTFNGWTAEVDTLFDADGDSVFTKTMSLFQDTMYTFKFWSTQLTWEDDPNRTYTVTGDANQEFDGGAFNKSFDDACGAATVAAEVEFSINMGVELASGKFDPSRGDVVTVAGTINGWNNRADTLTASFIDPNVYTGIVEADVEAPGTIKYKYVALIDNQDGTVTEGWEGVPDRELPVTGDEEVIDDKLQVQAEEVFYNNVTFEDIFQSETMVTVEVDARPAYYFLADSTFLPADTQTGDPVTAFTTIYANGPFFTPEGNWLDWGPENLGSTNSQQMFDDGTNGDAVAGDSIFTFQVTKASGTPNKGAGKFSTDGYDNESGFGGDHAVRVDEQSPTIRFVFGATQTADGTFEDDNGPRDDRVDYDPYILIDNTTTPPTVSVVRRGGTNDVTTSVEDLGGELPTSVSLSGNYPNPFNPVTTFSYTIDETAHVRVQVFDLLGREVALLVDGVQAASTYQVTFDAANLASGTYLYRLEAAGQVVTKTMVLLK